MYECSAARQYLDPAWTIGVVAIGLAVAGNPGCSGESGCHVGAVSGATMSLTSSQAFLDELGGGPVGLVLSGEPGIGKTILWQAGVDEARARFERVLTCRGAEAEAALSFAALSELLGGVLGDALDWLLLPRRKALEVALLLSEPQGGPPDPLAIGLAVHDVLRALAQHGPLLLAIDDVQWLDPGSAGALQVALDVCAATRLVCLSHRVRRLARGFRWAWSARYPSSD